MAEILVILVFVAFILLALHTSQLKKDFETRHGKSYAEARREFFDKE